MAVEHTLQGAHVKTRHPFAPLGLGLLTLGVYLLYWYYAVNRELRDLGEDVKPGRAVLAITLGGLLIVPAVMSMYNTATRIAHVQERAGVVPPVNPALAVVLLIIPIGNWFQQYYLQSGLNRAYEAMGAAAQTPDELEGPIAPTGASPEPAA